MENSRKYNLMHSDAYHDYGRRAENEPKNRTAQRPEPPVTRKRMRSMNFEEYASEGNRFINEVSWELGCDRNTAARVTRSVLHALRDRLPANDAVQFAQGLPMIMKAVFFDQYDISDTPVVVRTANDFLDMVYYKNRQTAVNDFPTERSVIEAVRGVFRVLENNMDEGQVEQIKRMLNREIVTMIDGY